ncbi:E3 ubiquitin-protein ligase TRIM45-like [Glandiceps talaboti]
MAAASRDSDVLNEIDEKSLSCPICLERYKNAKILPCLHSSCEDCFTTWLEKHGSLECPVCRRPVHLSKGGVPALKNSFFINSVVDLMKKREEKDGDVCEGCKGESIENRCVTCAMYLGAICTKAHKNVPATRGHTLMTREEFLKSKSHDVCLQFPPVNCAKHSENPLKFYCEKCGIPVCLECTVIDHRGEEHELKYLEEAKREYLEILPKELKQLQVKGDKIEKEITSLEKSSANMERSFQRENLGIKKYSEEMIKKVKEQEKQLLEQLKIEHGIRQKIVRERIYEAKNIKDDVSSTLDYVDKLSKYGNAGQLLSTRKETKQHLEQFKGVDISCTVPERKFNITFKQSDQLIQLGVLHGIIDPQKSSLEIGGSSPKTMKVGETWEGQITLRDQCGCRLDTNGKEIVAEVVNPSGRIEVPELKKTNDCFRVNFIPKKKGFYKVEISINSQHVRHSPYGITVSSNTSKRVLALSGQLMGPVA